MAHDVFISHSSQDKPVADAVCAALESAGIRCWIAPRDVQPGRSFAGEITRAIQRSRVMVLIFSANSNTSEQVLREVQLAANSHLHIIQFRIQDVIPNDDLEYYLSTPHWLDALTPPLERHLDRLGTSIKALLEMVREDSPEGRAPPPPAPVEPRVGGEDPVAVPKEPDAPEPTLSRPVTPPITQVSAGKGLPLGTKLLFWIGAVIGVVLAIALVASLRSKRQTSTAAVATETGSPSPTSTVVSSDRSPPPEPSLATTPIAKRSPVVPAYAEQSELGRNPAFAFVDMNRIFKEYRKTKDAETKINDAKNAAKREYDDRADAYKKALDEINKLNRQLESDSLNANAKVSLARNRDDKIAAIKQMEREINGFRESREKELQNQALRLRETIVNEITVKINESGFLTENFILDRSGMSANGVPLVMFAPTDADMSDRVISALNDNTRQTFVVTRAIPTGLVDMNQIFKNYNKTKDAEARVNSAKNAAKKEYDDRASVYKKALDDVNKLNEQLNSSSLSASARTKLVKDRDNKIAALKKMESEINSFRQSREKQLQEQALRMREGIVKEIEDLIGQKYEQARMVVDVSGATLNGVPWAVFTRGVPNLSNDIISDLNKTGGKPELSADSAFVPSDRLRFAQVDMDRVFKALPERKQAEAEITAAREKAKSELGDHPSAEARAAKEKQLQAEALEKRQPLVNKIVSDVGAVGDKYGFNLIFDASGKSLNGVPVNITSRDVPDVTAEVMADLGGKE